MILSYSGVRGIYNEVGDDKCKALLYKTAARIADGFTSDSAIDCVFNIIKQHKTITKQRLMKKCLLSSSTVNHSLNSLMRRRDITKFKDTESSGQPVTYSLIKK